MNINPHNASFGDTYQVDFNSDEIEKYQKLFREAVEKGEVVAIGPEDHLRALQQDLLKAGYKRIK